MISLFEHVFCLPGYQGLLSNEESEKNYSLERLTSHQSPQILHKEASAMGRNVIFELLPKMKPITVNVSLATLFVLIILSFFFKRKSGKAG